VGDSLSADKSKAENEASGEKAGADIATTIITDALKKCEIPSSVLN